MPDTTPSNKTQIVRVNLTVRTRKECSCLVKVPSDFNPDTDGEKLIEGIYQLTDPDDFTEDNEYWEQGDCSGEGGAAEERMDGMAVDQCVEVRLWW